MKNFTVRVREVWYCDVKVKAESAEQAKEKVEEGLSEETPDALFDYGLGRDEWDVREG